MCGHATVACLGLLLERELIDEGEGVLDLLCGDCRYKVVGDHVFMQQLPVVVEPLADAMVAKLCKVLGEGVRVRVRVRVAK